MKAEAFGTWWAAYSEKERVKNPAYKENQKLILDKLNERYGDRMNELVIIGQDLDEQAITTQLNACLVQDDDPHHFSLTRTFKDEWPL